jgi:class 3 adenylate cyclase
LFEQTYSRRFEAISAIIDLEGFSPFTTQPDNHRKLAEFLNFVFERVSDSLSAAGLTQTWVHRKFLGDGALYIWSTEGVNSRELGTRIVLAFHNLFRVYPTEAADIADEMGVRAVPRRIRVGIAQGEVTELRSESGLEYVGFSINLASRLQHYCTPIGFLVSCSVSLEEEFIDSYPLMRAKTKQIRGMPNLEEEVRFVKEDASGLRQRDLEKWLVLNRSP